MFSDGQLNTTIPITIINDNQPEVDEMFCVRLSLPEGGALLGNINQSKPSLLIQPWVVAMLQLN